MKQKTVSHRKQERGQTMILVAISLVSLLTVAALAIDVVTLYLARSEIQRAADAAAIAGAKAVADSGVTTLNPADPKLPTAKILAQTMATAAVSAMLNANPAINQVAGTQPALVLGSPTVTFPATATPPNSNPHVTVALQVTTLPTFFARIWGNRTATVTATATAEAYNPANVPNFTPIAPTAVKPWLVANVDPNNGGVPFIDTATGAIEFGGVEVVGETLNLHADCQAGLGCPLLPGGNPPGIGPGWNGAYPQVEYVPALITPNTGSNVCPTICGGTEYQQSVECADMTTTYQCGGSVNNANWDNTVNPGGLGGLSELGTECLIHALGTGNNQGQDTLVNPGWPASAMQITAGPAPNPQNGNLVTTSNSIVTIPIIDTSKTTVFQAGPPYGVTVVGFLQGFIDEVHGGGGPQRQGDIKVTVLNIAGCSSAPNTATPIVGGTGTSPVPVRLITPP